MATTADAIAHAGNSGATLRTGRVVGISGTQVTLDLGGGSLVAAPYLDSYVPILGDPVQIAYQPPVLTVLGRPAGIPGDNLLPNPSFEGDAIGTVSPAGWTSYIGVGNTGTTVPKVTDTGPFGTADGTHVYEIYMTVSGSSTYGLVSDPIPVSPGQRWTAAASWQAYADGVTTPMVTPLVELHLAFQASATDVYPTAISDVILMQGVGPFGSMPFWALLRDPFGSGTLVPAGAKYARVVLLGTNDTTGGVWLDKAICRRVS